MRVMIFAKSTAEAEQRPHDADAEGWQEMARFHQELEAAGVLVATGALTPSSEGVRVRFGNDETSVIDGPFTESKELVAGYWLWQVRSLEEAIEWLKRAPFRPGMELEVRPIVDMEMPSPDDATADG